MKTHANITIDSATLEKVKEDKFLNMSAICEDALIKHLRIEKVDINKNVEACEFCGKKMRQATPNDLNGLTWLYPDERWICPRCLLTKSRGITK